MESEHLSAVGFRASPSFLQRDCPPALASSTEMLFQTRPVSVLANRSPNLIRPLILSGARFRSRAVPPRLLSVPGSAHAVELVALTWAKGPDSPKSPDDFQYQMTAAASASLPCNSDVQFYPYQTWPVRVPNCRVGGVQRGREGMIAGPGSLSWGERRKQKPGGWEVYEGQPLKATVRDKGALHPGYY